MKQEDYARIAAWLSREEGAEQPEDISEAERRDAGKAWDLAGHYSYPDSDANAWHKFSARLQPEPRKNTLLTWMLGATAAAATVAAVYFSLYYKPQAERLPNTADAMVYYNSALGERKTITLPDESRITLNAGSGLWVLPDYGDQQRSVELKGEAFFEVRPDNTPFVVKGAAGSIKVLGTRFNAEAYGSNLNLQVAEGSVELEGAGSTLVVTAGHGGMVRSGQAPVAAEGDSTAWAWKNGQLSFRNTPIPDVVAEIERHYGVKVSYPVNLAQKRYTGTFDKLSCPQVLAILSAAMGSSFSIQPAE